MTGSDKEAATVIASENFRGIKLASPQMATSPAAEVLFPTTFRRQCLPEPTREQSRQRFGRPQATIERRRNR